MHDPQAGTARDTLAEKVRQLECENQRLRMLLAEHGIAIPEAESESQPALRSPKSPLGTAQKIAIFRSLFRGREDVYAHRWQSPDGRSGYHAIMEISG